MKKFKWLKTAIYVAGLEEYKASKTYDLMEINWSLINKFLANLALGGLYIFNSGFILISSYFPVVTSMISLSVLLFLTGWDLFNIIIGRRKLSDIIFEKFNKILYKLEINLISIISIFIMLNFLFILMFPKLIIDIFYWILLIQGVLLCILATILFIEKLLLLKKKKFSAMGGGGKGVIRYSLTTYNLESEKKNEDV